MVVIPAGTRNHFALDLGLDRDDVVGALDAYGPAVERTIDLGDVNGRVFVNNVSMGLYAVHRRVVRVSRRQDGDHACGAARRCSVRTPSRSTCASPAETACSTTAPTSSRSRTTPMAGRCRRWPHGRASTPANSASSPSWRPKPSASRASSPSSPWGIRNATRGSLVERRRASRSPRGRRSPWGSTASP